MTPISAVMAEPARAVIMTAVSTGAISRMRVRARERAEHALRAEHGHGVERLQTEHQPGEQSDEQNDEHGLCPDDVYLLKNLARQTPGMERLSEAFKEEQRHLSEAVQKIQDGCEYFIHDGTLLRWISRGTLADFTFFGNACTLCGNETLA